MEHNEKVTRKMLLQEISARSGVDIGTVTTVFGEFVDCLVDNVRKGKNVSITGFGNFYMQKHKGHPVQFESRSTQVKDYNLLKFSASDALNSRLRRKKKKPTTVVK